MLRNSKQKIFQRLSLSHVIDKKFGQLSIGTKRKVLLAIALINEPKIILLDQPISGLDSQFRQQFWELLNSLKIGRSIVVVSHDTSECNEYVEKFVIMNKGQIQKLWHLYDLKKQIRHKLKLIVKPNNLLLSNSNDSLINQFDDFNKKHKNIIAYKVKTSRLDDVVTQLQLNIHSRVQLKSISFDQQFIEYIQNHDKFRYQIDRNDRIKIIEESLAEIYNQQSSLKISNFKKQFQIFKILFLRRLRNLILTKRSIFIQILFILTLFSQYIFSPANLPFMPIRFMNILSLFLVEQLISRNKKYLQNFMQMGVNLVVYWLAVISADFLCFSIFNSVILLSFYTYLRLTSLKREDLILQEPVQYGIILNLIPLQLSSLCYVYFLSLFTSEPFVGFGFITTFNLFLTFYVFVQLKSFAFYIFPHLTGAYFETFLLGFQNKKNKDWPLYNEDLIDIFGWRLVLLQFGQGVFYMSIVLVTYYLWYRKVFSPRSFVKRKESIMSQYQQQQQDNCPIINCDIQNQKIGFKFNVSRGEIFAIKGPSESRKSTLIKTIQRIQPKKFSFLGNLEVLSMNVLDNKVRIPYNRVGICHQQDIYEPFFTVFKFLTMIGRLKGYSLRTVIRQVYMIVKLLDIEEDLQTKICKLSGGNRRKLCIGAALLGDPQLIVVDQISKGIDPIVSNDILLGMHQFIHKTNKTLLFTTHRQDEGNFISDRSLKTKSNISLNRQNRNFYVAQSISEEKLRFHVKKKVRRAKQEILDISNYSTAQEMIKFLKHEIIDQNRMIIKIEKIDS